MNRKVKVYLLHYNHTDDDSDYDNNYDRYEFIGVYGSKEEARGEMEHQVLAQYYECCDCADSLLCEDPLYLGFLTTEDEDHYDFLMFDILSDDYDRIRIMIGDNIDTYTIEEREITLKEEA